MQRKRDFNALSRISRRATSAARACGSSRSATGARARSQLVEIPTNDEINDNIVAFWRPQAAARAPRANIAYTYRLHWGATEPEPLPLAQVARDRASAPAARRARRLFVHRLRRRERSRHSGRRRSARCDVSRRQGQVAQRRRRSPIRKSAACALSFQLAAGSEKLIELRAQLYDGDDAALGNLGLPMDGLTLAPSAPPGGARLPPEAPLAMPVQSLVHRPRAQPLRRARARASRLRRVVRVRRRRRC